MEKILEYIGVSIVACALIYVCVQYWWVFVLLLLVAVAKALVKEYKRDIFKK